MVIIGGGVVGTNAAKIAVGMGAHVTIIDNNLDRLRELDDIFRRGKSPRSPQVLHDPRRNLHSRSDCWRGAGVRRCSSGDWSRATCSRMYQTAQ